jgi:hypothetical protein
MDDLWVVVWSPEFQGDEIIPIAPMDCNEEHEDQGMLVYRSKEAAEAMARKQESLYGGDSNKGVAMRLSEAIPLIAS